jgi:carbonyl reductase 1
LALQYPKSPYNDGPVVIYLTARDNGRGEKALQELQEDPSLKKAKALKADGGLAQIKFHALDISQTKSIQDFASFLKAEHPEGIDFGNKKNPRFDHWWSPLTLSVINNAGVALQGFGMIALNSSYPVSLSCKLTTCRLRGREENA